MNRPARPSHSTRDWSRTFGLGSAGVYYALAMIWITFAVLTAVTDRPSFLRGQNLANIVEQSSLIGILAIFSALVLISGNFDLSIGSVAALAGAITLSTADGIGLWPAILVALAVAATAGLVNGVIIQRVGINAFIVTLGALTAGRGLVNVITDGRRVSVEDELIKDRLDGLEAGFMQTPNLPSLVLVLVIVTFGVGAWSRKRRNTPLVDLTSLALGAIGLVALALVAAGVDYSWRLAKTAWMLILIMVVVAAVLRFTVVGRRLYAVGGNQEAARLAGINVDRYKIGALILSGLAAGVVGVLQSAKLGAITTNALVGAEFTAITAAVIGGVALFGGSGSVVKATAGTLILFSLRNGFNVMNLSSVWQEVIEGVVIVAAAAIYTIAQRREQEAVHRVGAGASSPAPTSPGPPSSGDPQPAPATSDTIGQDWMTP